MARQITDENRTTKSANGNGMPSAEKPKPKSSVLSMMPTFLHPYMELIRIEKPTGTILMFWPFAWGLTMAAYTAGLPLEAYFPKLGKSFVAAFLLRSSACTINDIFDRNMDAGVERCKTRPLPSGRISVPAAVLYLLAQYAAGVAMFYYTERGLALNVALFQLLPLFGIYPLMKRVTYWPQAWLGFAMNFGFITAWVSITNTVNLPIFAWAMASCWCWTMLYDTIYACQDIRDDVKMGVRSTAILFGTWIRPLLISFGIAFVAMLAYAGKLNNQGTPYFVVSIGGTVLHLLWQYRTVDLDVPKSCWDNFNSNGRLGWIVWGGLMLDYLVAHDHLGPFVSA
ncbi:UbiA prenyltransferase family-domain-containing protein [Mycena capillaripes]|nr:UbiA prenyltransferase family-domain-containing protein [Mycena capillaripes]